MSTTSGTPAAPQSPIINQPYLPPTRYWTRYKSGALELTMLQQGQHPASGLLATTPDFKPRNLVEEIANNPEDRQPRLALVNDIRTAYSIFTNSTLSKDKGLTPLKTFHIVALSNHPIPREINS